MQSYDPETIFTHEDKRMWSEKDRTLGVCSCLQKYLQTFRTFKSKTVRVLAKDSRRVRLSMIVYA